MDQKNFIVAIVLSVLIIVGWQYAFPPAKPPVNQQQTASTQNGTPQAPTGQPGARTGTQGTAQPGAPAAQPAQIVSRSEALARSPRVTFDTPELIGSITLKGARIDDVRLAKYRVTVDPKSDRRCRCCRRSAASIPITPSSAGRRPIRRSRCPAPTRCGPPTGPRSAPGKPARLTWDNGQGLIFALDVSLDEFFMFDVKQSVENKTDKPVTLYPWSLVVRYGEPPAEGIYILHEGPYGVFNGSLKEFGYSDFKDNKQQKISTTGGWVGITDKYWMATLVPDQKQKVDVTIKQTGSGNELKYQIDYIAPGQAIAPGTSATTDAKLFAGAKIVRVISDYEKKYGIEKFDLTIDWGWFSFFTRPLFWLLEWLYVQLGNFGLSILVLTVIVKAVFFPLANKSYAAMSKMKALQPEMEKLKERYGEDRQRMNQELMQLYRREKVNPAAGCLPILVQIPVFFALYKVLYTTIEMRHQPFYGWIKDLAAPDPLTIMTGFGLFHVARAGVPAFLQHRHLAHHHGRDDVPAAEAEPAADRSGAGARLPVPADPVHLHAGAVRGRPGDLLGVEQHPVDRPAVHDHAPPRHADRRRQGQARRGCCGAGARTRAGTGRRRRRWRRQEGRQGQEALMAEYAPEEIEAARKLFAGPCEFVAGAASPESMLAISLPEVAFAGRSNVGKSSLVNALTGRRTLARTSSNPGHTRQINFFDLAGRLFLVDLPGYGFAQVSRSMKEAWQDLASAYLRGRPTLKRVCLLIDSRHGVKETDRETMKNLDRAAVSYQLVLTKCDQLKAADVPRAVAAAEAVARKHGAAHPEVLPTSSETGFGIAELRAEIAAAGLG